MLDNETGSSHVFFQYVLPSYEWGRATVESIERRIEGLATSILGIGALFLLAVQAFGGDLTDLRVEAYIVGALALVCILAGVFIGLRARAAGDLSVLDISKLDDEDFSLSPDVARRKAIRQAGEDLNANTLLVEDKDRKAKDMMKVLILEVLLGAAFVGLAVTNSDAAATMSSALSS